MATEVCDIRSAPAHHSAVVRSAEILAAGGLVVVPTETVYGLAANAVHPQAMERLRRLKERPADHPFTVHLGQPEHAARYLIDVPSYAKRMMGRGWPGPLTLVFAVSDPTRTQVARETPDARALALFRRGTIGLRCPDHGFAQALLSALDFPVVAASANRAGLPPPVEGAGIRQQLGGQVELIVDAGRCRYAQPSTVVSVTGRTFKILREGTLDECTLRNHAALNILLVCTGNTCRSPMAEVMLRDLLAKRLGIPADLLAEAGCQVSSAGLHGLEGAPASDGALHAMELRGLDLSRHVARTVDVGMLQRADHVWVMCGQHLQGVTAMVPSLRDRACLLAGGEDVKDPIGESQEYYYQCADKLARSLQARLQEVEL